MATPDTPCRCGGTGWLVAAARYGEPAFGSLVRCSCALAVDRAKAALAHERRLSGLAGELGRLRGCTFENFDPARALRPLLSPDGAIAVDAQRAALQEAFEAARAYADTPIGWLYLHGTVGAGKSHLAAAVARVAADRGVVTAYASTPVLMRFLKSGFSDHSADERITALAEVGLLVLDDLGAEQGTAWEQATLYELLNTRYLYERPTVITSNLSPDELDPRLADRIIGLATVLTMPISSYRRLTGG